MSHPAPRAPRPTSGRDFTLLWSAGAVSGLGSETSALALPLLMLSMTGSADLAGLVATVAGTVRTIARLPAGAVADRLDRRRLLMTADAARLLTSLTVGLAVLTGLADLPVILAAVAAGALFDVVFSPAEHAAIRHLVPREHLATAFARNEGRSSAAAMAGPALGGFLFALTRAAPFLADAASYLVSLVLLRAIETPMQDPPPSAGSAIAAASGSGSAVPAGRAHSTTPIRAATRAVTDSLTGLTSEITTGLTHVARTPFLRAVLLITAPANAALTAATFTTTIALHRAGTPATTIGLAQAAIGAGGVLGALAAPWLQQRLHLRQLLITISAALFAGAAAASALSGRWLMTLPLAVAFFLAPAINAALLTRLATTVPDHLQSRVLSVAFLASSGPASLAPAAAGVLTTHCGATATMTAATALLVLPLLAAALARGIRS